MTADAAAMPGLVVEIALHEVVTRLTSSRIHRLVLRRTVHVPGWPGNRVDELWTSGPLPAGTVRQALDSALGAATTELVLAESIVGLCGMHASSAAGLDDLDSALSTGATPRLLAAYHGRVMLVGVSRRLLSAELAAGSGLAAHQARRLLITAIRRLGATPVTGDTNADTNEEALGYSPDGAAPGLHQTSSRPSVTDAIASARAQLDQIEHWHMIAVAPSSTTPLVDATRQPAGPAWTETTQELPAVADTAPPDCVIATFVGVSGGIAGSDGRQTNLFQYRLSPRINLHRALGNPGVLDAFTRYATYAARPGASPVECEALRAAAVDSLRSALPGGETQWRANERPTGPIEEATSTRIQTLEGVVVLQDCRGIQVGNHALQYNTFNYTLAPTVAAGTLLEQHPGLAESIVDRACSVNPSERNAVQEQLSDAVCGAAGAALSRAPGAGIHSLPARVTGDGQIAGVRAHQTDSVQVNLDTLGRIGEQFKRVQHEISVARQAELRQLRLDEVAAASRAKPPDPVTYRGPHHMPNVTAAPSGGWLGRPFHGPMRGPSSM